MFGRGDRVVIFDLMEKVYIYLLAVSFPGCVRSEQVTNLKWKTWNLIPSLADELNQGHSFYKILPWTVRRACSSCDG